jgi:hypothetical protein
MSADPHTIKKVEQNGAKELKLRSKLHDYHTCRRSVCPLIGHSSYQQTRRAQKRCTADIVGIKQRREGKGERDKGQGTHSP